MSILDGREPDPRILTPAIVQTLLVTTMQSITGLAPGRVIVETEAGPRPSSGLYCSLYWKRIQPLAQNEGSYRTDESGDYLQYLNNESYCSVQVNFWGPGAMQAAAYAAGALQDDSRNFDLWRPLGYGGVGDIQDISTSFGGKIQQRVFFDLEFYACLGAEYPADFFSSSQWREALPLNNYSYDWTFPDQEA
jgi:hypothetical protein